ncbi:MAG: periplasmic heavy metal sensor [Thermoanaerobaculales bacterium]|jgi:hypothetical protein|nr:periplasmic heavy metal sensor [Thermoanaerobaculales bacterium]
MKHLIVPIILLALAAPAAAQEEGPAGDLGPIAGGAHQMVVVFLQLDEAQVEAWDLLWTDHRDAEEPIRQQIADVQQAIDDLFATGAPDPTELGLLIIERRALGEALEDVHVVYAEGFQYLLDDEQAQRLHQLRVAERIQGFIPAFKAFELVKR